LQNAWPLILALMLALTLELTLELLSHFCWQSS
jgi:hypothetical protein